VRRRARSCLDLSNHTRTARHALCLDLRRRAWGRVPVAYSLAGRAVRMPRRLRLSLALLSLSARLLTVSSCRGALPHPCACALDRRQA
jgi:hypothetical protein